MSTLHLVNGDCAVQHLKHLGIQGEILSWMDMLHEGRVRALPLQECSELRAQTLAHYGYGELQENLRRFEMRDWELLEKNRHDSILIWNTFELFDQLQLMQMLDFYQDLATEGISIRVLFLEDYLGCLDSVEGVVEQAGIVDDQMLRSGSNLWRAFGEGSPESLFILSSSDRSGLPFMQKALRRLFQEYPCPQKGVNKTERLLLEIIASGETRPGKVFKCFIEKDQPNFYGDLPFFKRIEHLCNNTNPAIRKRDGSPFFLPELNAMPSEIFRAQELEITGFGVRVLKGDVDFLEENRIDRYIGGVHLDSKNCPRFDPESGKFS